MKTTPLYHKDPHGYPGRPAFGIRNGALALLALATVGIARAGVVTQNVQFNFAGSSQKLYFNKFDAGLGTLTGISLAWTANSAITTASVTNNLGDSVTLNGIEFYNTFRASVNGTRLVNKLNDEVIKSFDPAIVLGSGESHTENDIYFTQVSEIDTFSPGEAMTSSLTGAGSAVLDLTSSFLLVPDISSSGGTTSTTINTTSINYGNLLVTYNYDDAPIAAVPEPSDILLCTAPVLLFGMGYVRRFRKSRISRN